MKVKITAPGIYKFEDGTTTTVHALYADENNCMVLHIDGDIITGPPGSGGQIGEVEIERPSAVN